MKDITAGYEFLVLGARKRVTRTHCSGSNPTLNGTQLIGGCQPERKSERRKIPCRCPQVLEGMFIGVVTLVTASGFIVLSSRLASSVTNDRSFPGPRLVRQGLIYPETYLDSHPYDYASNSLRPPRRYRRLPLHAPPRIEHWYDNDYSGSGSVDDPWKERWYGDLEDIHWEPVNKRDTKYGTYEEMLTTEGSPSEDAEGWLDHAGDKDYKHYYAFDDDFERGQRVSYNGVNPDSSDDTPPSKCRRTAQHRLMFPTCNEVHQMDFSVGSTYSSGFRFVNHGTFRDVFGMVLGKKPVAIKEIRYKQVDADHELFEYVRVDALVAERLSTHPRSFQLYSYCGLTVVSEFFFHGDIERQAFWESNDSSDKGIVPDQKTTPEQKLVLSLEMAQGLALLHGNPDGMIIHGDVQMSQFLLSKDKTMLKLNDFNRAEILLWDETHNDYCQHRNGVGRGTWRAPEEYRNDALSDKVDIFSLGNNMLTILTGKDPVLSTKTMGSKAFRRGIVDGMTGIIDPKYWNETGSKAEHALADVIQKCFAYKPEDRPTIFEVVHELERAVQEMEKEKGTTRTHILQTL